MDAFEQVVAEVLWEEGHWVQRSVKVDLTKEQKRRLGNPSMPRPEFDIVAYQGRTDTIKIVECKSYIDSKGVQAKDVIDQLSKGSGRYKIFHKKPLRDLVFRELRRQLTRRGLCGPRASIVLCLACGHISSEPSRQRLKHYFEMRRWELFDDMWLRSQLKKMKKSGYQNQVSTIVVKMLKPNG